MGIVSPPLYKTEDVLTIIDKISKVDEEINELMIKREQYVEALKKEIEKTNSLKD